MSKNSFALTDVQNVPAYGGWTVCVYVNKDLELLFARVWIDLITFCDVLTQL